MLYNVIFTAGGRLKGAKISEAEYAMFKLHAEAFKLKYPQASIHDKLGMATLEIDDISELEKDPTIYSISKMNNFQPQATIQQNAPWHLLDISHAQYSSYEYTTSGKGIDVYILDTGIDASHTGLKNVVKGMVIDEPTDAHGTHVAGCAQSVAKDCRLIDIQVFHPYYPSSIGAIFLLAGINWLLNIHEPGYVAIANMSIGGEDDGVSYEAEKSAIQALMAEGVICVVAAGNEGVDASTFAPANTPGVICVGAYDSEHAQASFSNFGSTVNIWAPGVGITSTVFNNSYAAYDGTSMAAPIVAGVCARYLELCPYITHAEMLTRLTTYATAGRVSADMPGFSKNKKLGKRLEGMVNGQRYGVVHRYPTVFRQSSYGVMELATEVTKVTIPEVPNPTVPTPIVLPEPFGYDDGVVFINADMSIEFLTITYQPTSIVDTTFNYNYPGTIILSITLNEDKSYTIQVTSQKVFTFTYYGFDARIELDGTLTYKGFSYSKNNVNYDYDYPEIRVSISAERNLTFGVPDMPPPPPVVIKPLIQDAILPNPPEQPKNTQALEPLSGNKVYDSHTLSTFSTSNVITIDVEDPNKLMSYAINLGFASGTFNYSGIGITKHANRTALTVQGHNGTVERVKESIAFGQPPLTIEGRLLPLFTAEYVNLKKEKQKAGTPYYTADLIKEIAAQADTAVTFSATNTKLKEYDYAGRFTSALESLAEESCGYLLQQNGQWFIRPFNTYSGTYVLKEDALVSLELSANSDCLETIMNYAKSLYNMILQKDEAQRALDNIQNQLDNKDSLENLPSDPAPSATSWSDEDWQPAGEVDFSFGFTGRYPLVKMNDNIYVDASIWASTAWEEWDAKASKDTNYFWKVEEYNYKDTDGEVQYKMRGLKNLNMVHLYYPISASEDGVLYRAIGDVKNMSLAIAYAGDKDIYGSVDPVKVTKTVSIKSGDTIQSVTTTSFYLDFTCNAPDVYAPTTSREDKNFYYAKLKLEYLPSSSKPWKFSVNIVKDYTLLYDKGYLIPDAGGAVLNKNGNEVAQYDRTAMTIKLQNGAIVSTVTRATDTTDSEGNVVYGKPTVLTPPQDLEAGIEAWSGTINTLFWPMRTQAGQLFGYINSETGGVYYTNNNQIGSCTLPWTSNLMLINIRDQKTLKAVTVGIIQNSLSNSPTASFGNSIDYPIVTADANYAKLQQALLNYQKTELETDVDYAKDKINCLKNRLAIYGIIDLTGLEAATTAWKKYYDAEYKVNNPKILADGSKETPPTQNELDTLKSAAETADKAAFNVINSCKTTETTVSAVELYKNELPLAGQSLISSIDNLSIPKDCIIESVAFNGLTTTITAKAIVK